MNSLSYLSRQYDVLASASAPTTPPSTPTGESYSLADGSDTRPQLKRIRTWSSARSFFFSTPEQARSEHLRRRLVLPPLPTSSASTSSSVASSTDTASSSSSAESVSASTSASARHPAPPTSNSSPVQSKSLTPEPSWIQQVFFIRVLVLLTNWLGVLWLGFVHSLRHEPRKQAPETSRDEKDGDSDLVSALEARLRAKTAGRTSYVRAHASSIVEYVLQPQTKSPTPSPLSQSIVPPPPTFNLIPPDLSNADDDQPPLPPSVITSYPLSASNLSPRTPPRGRNAQSSFAPPSPPARAAPLFTRKTLVLDLDETLIHSTTRPLFPAGGSSGLLNLGNLIGFGRSRGGGHMVEVVLGGRSTLYHVYKRPFVDYFLRKVSTWYTLVIFTASMKEYADPVIDWLDAGRGILALRFFREHCTQLPNGAYSKDLSVLNEDLARICLIDNSPVSYSINQANGIPIEGWTHDPNDEALLDLLPFLDSLRFTSDVRHVLGLRGF
ncbi:hypothetical protein M0805_007407 [Coniferiporia weirii]|nr:hypothetical protein M0805_007407 [Coniferiporia weirii]